MLRYELLELKNATRVPVNPLTDLTTLPAVHLAVLSLRADLDVLLRQRAYHAFLVKAAEGNGCGGARGVLPFNFPVSTVPDSLDSLALEQLLYIQFHPDCDSDPLATQAYSVFLAKLDAEIANLPLDFLLRKYTMCWDGGEREDEGEMVLRLEERGVKVVERGEVLFVLVPERVHSFHAEKSVEAGPQDSSTVLVLRLSQVDLGPYISIRELEVRLFLETADLAGGLVERLTVALASWAEEEEQALAGMDEHDAKSEEHVQVEAHFSTPSTASSISTDAASKDNPATAATSIPPPSPTNSGDIEERHKKRVKRDDNKQEREKWEEPWQFLSERSVYTNWHPGLFIRHFALLRAVAPLAVKELLDPPSFTLDEIAIASLASDPSKLPSLPKDPPRVPEEYRYDWEDRLALERIYQEKEHVTVDQTRFVLLTSAYPSLRRYAKILGKVVRVRHLLTRAYDTILEARLYPRARDKNTVDPIERIIALFERLRDDVEYRKVLFTPSQFTLADKAPFSSNDIGIGPMRRFDAELKQIVEYERQAFQMARKMVKRFEQEKKEWEDKVERALEE